ncbi:MAG: hypothetical protein Q9183_004754, partial [Haloplaca sp. 2 TL-2023]
MVALLPIFVIESYTKYKKYEKAVLSWLAATSNQCGWRSTSPPTAKTSLREGTRLQETADPVLPGNTPTPSRSSKQPTKYFLAIDEIVPRTDLVVNNRKSKPRVPQYIIQYLQASIALRSKCSEWFSKHMGGIRSVQESTENHLQFKQIMEEVLLKLEPYVESTKIPTSTGKTKRASGDFAREAAAAKLKFTNLEVQDPKDYPENDIPAESLVDAPEELPDPPQLEEIYEAEPTIEDKLMEMSSVLDTLQELRKHVQELWTQYQKRELSLIVATIMTNTAIDLARMKEDGFAAQFPDTEAWEKLTVELFPNEEQLWTKSMDAFTPGDQGEIDRL